MKPTLSLRFILTLLVLIASGVGAGAKTWLTEATAVADDAAYGEVFASDKQTTSPGYTSPSSVKEQKSFSLSGSSKEHTYYLYARAKDGGKFLKWVDSNGDFVSNDAAIKVSILTSTDGAKIARTWKAVFIEDTYVSAKGNEYGQAFFSPLVNKPGDTVTLTCEPIYEVMDNDEFIRKWGRRHNRYCRFSHWTDETGATVSEEPTFSVQVDGRKEYTAVFKLMANVRGKGYYRVWTGSRAVARVAGTRKISISFAALSAVSVFGDIDAITNPYGGEYFLGRGNHKDPTGYSGEHLYNFYDNPSGIIYIDGTFNPGPADNWENDAVVVSGANLGGQGVWSKDFLSSSFDIAWTVNPGYYQIVKSSAALGYMWDTSINARCGTFKVGLQYHNHLQQFDICPITEEFMDDEFCWFGACPDPMMEFDGGWWTSMYTAFPYRLVEQDGHEAYIVIRPEDGSTDHVVLKKIENGIVPANTAVLIKCQAPADEESFLKYNCMNDNFTPLEPQNRLIPLEPDDPTIDASVSEGNLLKGVFQLNTDVPDNLNNTKEVGHIRFDEMTMRVFSVNAAGTVGFYKLPQVTNADGQTVDAELAANRAYLDLTMLPASMRNRTLRLVTEEMQSGVQDVSVDRSDNYDRYFDIYGRPVAEENLQPGSIYISGGKKILYR